MADKRMFSLSVVDTDWFLDLPLSTQALYFHLNMRADDDGFVDAPNSIVRKIGASKNDFDLLVAKRYVLRFESGIIVIKHWRMHNTIQKDRYHPTQFQDEMKKLAVKDNKSYTDNLDIIRNVSKSDTKRIQNVSSGLDIDLDLDIDLGINNNTLGHSTIENDTNRSILFERFWKEYPKKVGKDKCLNWFKNKSRNITEDLVNQMVESLTKWKNSEQWTKDNGQYIPNPYTWLNRGGWNDEVPEQEFSSYAKRTIEWESL